MLLDFVNIGESALIIALVMFLTWLGLIIFCISDIAKARFKLSLMKFFFLLLVIIAPFVGSIVYLAVRNRYKISS